MGERHPDPGRLWPVDLTAIAQARRTLPAGAATRGADTKPAGELAHESGVPGRVVGLATELVWGLGGTAAPDPEAESAAGPVQPPQSTTGQFGLVAGVSGRVVS
ncbi:MAG: hypothetical protein ACLPVY_06315 [Acidimicrobiia bacterium]